MNEINKLCYEIWKKKRTFYRVTIGAFGLQVEKLRDQFDGYPKLDWYPVPVDFDTEQSCIRYLQQILGGE